MHTVPFQNEISEEEQRWGSKTVEGSTGRAGALRYETKTNCHLDLYGKAVHSLWSCVTSYLHVRVGVNL